MAKPILTISNFKPIQDGGSYFLQGFTPEIYGNQTVLAPLYRTTCLRNSSDTGYSHYHAFEAMTPTKIGTTDTVYQMDGSGYIFMNNIIYYPGEIKKTNEGINSNPDIMTTKNETLLYTQEKYLGLAYRFKATSVTGTSLVVAGETFFATYGIDDDTRNGTIYNLTKREQYINTTATPTTTLNFSAPTTAPSTNDEFVVFVDRAFTFLANTGRDEQFNGQPDPSTWVRQITSFGNDYYILNGNYLAVLQSDETTFAATEKALPYQTQATCISSNSDKIIVGCDFKSSGKLLLWDGESSFWNYSLDLPKPIEAITPYNGNFIVLSAGTLYWTNGYELQEISTIPDTVKKYGYGHYNGLKVLGDELFVCNNSYNFNRFKIGIYVYDFKKKGWSFVPATSKTMGYPTYGINCNALFYFADWDYLYCGTSIGLNSIRRISSTSCLNSYYAQFMIDLPERMKISMVELSLSTPNTYLDNNTDYQTDVIVSVGDGRKGFYRSMQLSDASTTTKLVSTNELNYETDAEVDEQIEIVDGNTDTNSAGEKRFITVIADPSTATVDYTVAAIASKPLGTVNAMLYKLKKQNTVELTIQSLDLSENLQFPISDFYGDKLNLEVLFQNHTGKSAFALNINSIKIY